MKVTQAEVEAGAEAIWGSVIGQALKLNEHEAKKIAELVLEAAEKVRDA